MIPPLPHNSTTLVLRRTFPATRHRVFQAWIKPEVLEQWFKPLGMSVTVRSLEARVGGSFRFETEDGNSTVGTYLSIIPPRKTGLYLVRRSNAGQGNRRHARLSRLGSSHRSGPDSRTAQHSRTA